MPNWIWPNRYRGEVVAEVNGRRRIMRLSLSALAQIEACYGDVNIAQLSGQFASQGMAADDAENIIRAGLAAAGDETANHPHGLQVKGGEEEMRHLAHQLLSAAFTNWTEK